MKSEVIRRLTGASLLAAAVIAPVVAQEVNETPEPQESKLVEQVAVRLVQITIFATDKDGGPVTDLRPEELKIKDGGQKVDVAFLDPRTAAASAEITARLFVEAPGGPALPVSTFRGEPRFYVVLLDLIHEPTLGRDRAKAQLTEFFGEELDQDELVSVLSYTGRINMESSFVNNAETLSSAVDNAFKRRRVGQGDPERRVYRLMQRLELCKFEDQDGVVTCIQQVSGSYQQEAQQAEQEYLGVLLGAVKFAAGLSGRKSLVVLGQGASLSSELELNAAVAAVFDSPYTGLAEGNDYGFDQVVLSALEHGVVLHFVSAPPAGRGSLGAGAVGRADIGVDPIELAHRGASEAMTHIAVETGGSHHETAEVGEGLRDIVALERSGYVLGYYLGRDRKKDRKLRRVKIKCSRPGVTVNAPRGYRVEPEVEQVVQLELRMSQPTSAEDDDTWRIPFQVVADPREVGYEMKRGAASASFVLETAVFDDSGRLLTRTFNIINHSYDGTQWESGDIEPVVVEGWVELPHGAYELRAALRNYKNVNEGSITRRFRLE